MPEHIRQEPKVLVSTENLTEQEWLAYRRRGIGGSDVAAILGISPFRTARDLYDDKLNIASVADDAGNWVALEMGHLLEPLVARIFAKKTGLEVFQIKKMFQHPQYPFMLADVDYFVRLPNGKIAILEIKTTNYNAKDHWWKDGEECVPVYYETQGRHYMTVMDIDEIFYCCLYGNNEDEVIIRHLYRDREYEQEMIYLEREFWHDHILTRIPPPYTEDGSLILESLRRRLGAADKTIPAIQLDNDLSATMLRYLRLQEQKQQVETRVRTLDTEMQRLKGQMVAKLNGSCMAMGEYGGTQYTIWLSSIGKPHGVTSGSPLHFVGEPFAKTVYVTEGLLKADIAHCLTGRSFVAVAGVNSLNGLESALRCMAQNGTKLVVEAYDMDKSENEYVADAAEKVQQIANAAGLQSTSLVWNTAYKGIDDWQLALRQEETKEKAA